MTCLWQNYYLLLKMIVTVNITGKQIVIYIRTTNKDTKKTKTIIK